MKHLKKYNEEWFPKAENPNDMEFEVCLLDGDIKLYSLVELTKAFHEYADEESFLAFISDGNPQNIGEEDYKWLNMFYNDNPTWIDEYNKHHDENTNENINESKSISLDPNVISYLKTLERNFMKGLGHNDLRKVVNELEKEVLEDEPDRSRLMAFADDISVYMEEMNIDDKKIDDVYNKLYNYISAIIKKQDDEEFRLSLAPEEGGPTRELEVEGWLTFMDGQDGSYSIALHGTREEAAARLGTDNPVTTYDDGALEPIKFKVILKNGKYIIDPKGARVSIDG